MKRYFPVPALVLMAALSLSALRPAAASPDDLVRKYPQGSISSVDQADAAVREVQREREEIETKHADAEYACYSKFFSSPCVDKAKEARRVALGKIGGIEVEAKAFRRRDTVVKRDQLLEEQRARDASEAPARAEQEKLNLQKSEQKAADVAARQAAPEKQPLARKAATPKADTTPRVDGRDRIAEHEARMEKARTEEAADAGKRARNIADYQRKGLESQERQRKVAQKKAEAEHKERERAAKTAP
jgi:colicin import membrane protein